MSVIGSSGSPRFDYHPAAEFAGGAVGALWDISKWKRQLFQDSAAATPVTASGQPVGCIRNVLGDTSWDLIQANAGNRPTFNIIAGVPRVECGFGTGMYSRGVQSMVVPAFICTGMRHVESGTTGRVILGVYKNDGNYLYLAGGTVGELAADTTGVSPPRAVARKTATSPQFSCPGNAVDAVSALIDAAGTLSIRQADESPAIAVQGSPGGIDQATAWVNGDTVAGMTVNLNAGGQNSVTNQPVSYHSDAITDFFGGMMMMGAVPANREGCHHFFRRQYAPIETPRASDKIYAWVGDSTGDNQLNTTVFVEPPFKIATDYFVVNHPEASVFYVEWCRQYDRLTGVQRLSTGSTDARIYVPNFSVSGSEPDYFMGERWARSVGALPHLDALFVNHGQNLAVAAAPSVYDTAGYLRRGDWFQLSEKVRKAFPAAPQLFVRTYEINIAGNTTIDAAVAALDAVVAAYADGTATTDVMAKFNADGNPSTYFQSDHVHLAAPGVQAFVDKAGPDITAFLASPPANVAPPLVNRPKVAANIAANGRFDTWTNPANPDSWTPSGVTCARSVEHVDSEMGDQSSLKVTGNGYVEQSINLAAYRGKALTIYVRLFLDVANADTISGQIQFLDDSPTGANSHGNSWLKTFFAKPCGAWMAYPLCTKPIPADATTCKIRLYAGQAAGKSAYFGRCILSEGSAPRDIQQ